MLLAAHLLELINCALRTAGLPENGAVQERHLIRADDEGVRIQFRETPGLAARLPDDEIRRVGGARIRFDESVRGALEWKSESLQK